jgi:phthalate 4,5-cis-dihydrodiol dehydrogenase
MTVPPALQAPLRIGVAGLGRAFTIMLPTFRHDARVRLVAAADPSAPARARFSADFGAPAHDSVEALCADPQVQVVYVATPHQLHRDHVALAAAAGKHVLVEKPMAITLQECQAMVDACTQAGVHMIVGHSHSFDAPILRLRALIASGRYGRVRMIHAMNYTDFLYRPRRPEELDTRAGGGVVFSQGAHQIDIVRLIGGGRLRSVRAFTGQWDPARPTEGAYSALLGFADGSFCSATYSGYAHYDSDVLMGQIGEMGQPKDPADYGAARRRLQDAASAADEHALKAARNYGGALSTASDTLPVGLAHQHFGHLLVSCEGADLRPTATGIEIFADRQRLVETLPLPQIPRSEVIDELFATVVDGRPPLHSGAWALATTEACLAILESARNGTECLLHHQVEVPAP